MSDERTTDLTIPPQTVRRGQRLAERQRAHLFELELTGRWRRYFKTEEELKASIEAASRRVDEWTQLMPVVVAEEG
jgi:hypothetical protein